MWKKKSIINYQQPKIYLFFYLANSYQLSRCVKQATCFAYKEGDSKKWKILLILKIVWYKICFQRINFLYLRDTINELRASASRPKFLLAQFFRLGYSVKLIPYTHQLLIQLFFSRKFSTLVHRTERKRRSKKKKLGKPLLWHTEVLTAKDLLVYTVVDFLKSSISKEDFFLNFVLREKIFNKQFNIEIYGSYCNFRNSSNMLTAFGWIFVNEGHILLCVKEK